MSVWETAVPYLHLAWLGAPGVVAWLRKACVCSDEANDLRRDVSFQEVKVRQIKLSYKSGHLSCVPEDWQRHLNTDRDVKKIRSARP